MIWVFVCCVLACRRVDDVLCFDFVCVCVQAREQSHDRLMSRTLVSYSKKIRWRSGHWGTTDMSVCLSLSVTVSLSPSLSHWSSLVSVAPQKVRETVSGKFGFHPPPVFTSVTVLFSSAHVLHDNDCHITQTWSKVLLQFMARSKATWHKLFHKHVNLVSEDQVWVGVHVFLPVVLVHTQFTILTFCLCVELHD